MAMATITTREGVPAGDLAALSASDRRALHALFAHPLPHNLAWRDMIALFGALGTVEEKPNSEFSFRIGGEHHLMRGPHTKDLTAPEVLALRHFAASAGWSPDAPPRPAPGVAATGLLVVVDHHEARIYEIDVASADASEHVIRPYDPHHFLHHLAHKDQSRERGQRAPEDGTFYERIARALAAAEQIVLVGHGTGKSNAAQHLSEYLRSRHYATYQHVVRETAADISHVTEAQLLAIAREALV
jgi:hypothetical protein